MIGSRQALLRSRFACYWCGAALALLAGCGYSLRGNVPGHIQTVAVPIFANKTQAAAVENVLTKAVSDAFVTNGRLKVVRPEDADAILEGEIVGYRLTSVSYDRSANAQEYRLIVTLNLQFRDVRRNVTMFHEEGVQQQADFKVPGSVASTISTEESALRVAAVDIGRSIVNRVMEQF